MGLAGTAEVPGPLDVVVVSVAAAPVLESASGAVGSSGLSPGVEQPAFRVRLSRVIRAMSAYFITNLLADSGGSALLNAGAVQTG